MTWSLLNNNEIWWKKLSWPMLVTEKSQDLSFLMMPPLFEMQCCRQGLEWICFKKETDHQNKCLEHSSQEMEVSDSQPPGSWLSSPHTPGLSQSEDHSLTVLSQNTDNGSCQISQLLWSIVQRPPFPGPQISSWKKWPRAASVTSWLAPKFLSPSTHAMHTL